MDEKKKIADGLIRIEAETVDQLEDHTTVHTFNSDKQPEVKAFGEPKPKDNEAKQTAPKNKIGDREGIEAPVVKAFPRVSER